MKTNVVDDMGDDYFMMEYRNAAYIHEGKPYRLKGFNIGGKFTAADTRAETREQKYCKADFDNDKQKLIDWIETRKEVIEELQENEPQQYEMYIDDDGDERESEDLTEEWEDWQTLLRRAESDKHDGEQLLERWDSLPKEAEKEEDCLEFTPLFKTNSGQLLLKVKEFTSLKGFAIKQGFMNTDHAVMYISYRRAWKIPGDRADLLKNDKNAETLLTERKYPTLKEALHILNTDKEKREIALSPTTKLWIETRNSLIDGVWKKTTRWHVVDDQSETLARWDEGKSTMWAKNNKIMTILSKKG